ncbi:MAG: helix-turn-helix transcriptional regulator [Bacteroidota bacterium]|jgi:AraC family transcriptional activator of pyochelin receptor|nr:helix-turn-helix transcriptional regulator [Cytophagales bacterium]MCE2956218.1 AraC family transcriptional regulator [Flammeovirgaceae bacterium]MCZ8070058.1 AraC family transcriptional regulator [Cytophagales bacterium]
MQLPTVYATDFVCTKSNREEEFGFVSTEWVHPDFGTWSQKTLDLGFLKVEQNRSQFKEKINVAYDADISNVVHHCISLDGTMGAHLRDFQLDAQLHSLTYHNMYLSGSSYHLSIDRSVVNVHIEIQKDYYQQLLPMDEPWADEIRETLAKKEVYYPGDFPLTAAMAQSIYAIFNSPLSGQLKKMLVEAKIQELMALQLFGFKRANATPKDRNLMHDIRDYLDQHFLEDHSLKSICQQFGVNEFKLKSEFKACFNTTVFDYLWSKKMEYAHTLLADQHLRLVEVAQRVGYQHSHHFATAFKRKFGYSPSALVS